MRAPWVVLMGALLVGCSGGTKHSAAVSSTAPVATTSTTSVPTATATSSSTVAEPSTTTPPSTVPAIRIDPGPGPATPHTAVPPVTVGALGTVPTTASNTVPRVTGTVPPPLAPPTTGTRRLPTGSATLTSCVDLADGTVRWTAHVRLSDGQSGNVGPYVQTRGTAVIEPPVLLARDSVQVTMQLSPKGALGLCVDYGVVVSGNLG